MIGAVELVKQYCTVLRLGGEFLFLSAGRRAEGPRHQIQLPDGETSWPRNQ